MREDENDQYETKEDEQDPWRRSPRDSDHRIRSVWHVRKGGRDPEGVPGP